ncbi:MAG: hypothetical protein O7H39_01060 [Gammaproteobacteria bacterium]|nr:hypothetical protein [Gammaproteobacteria bacterium]
MRWTMILAVIIVLAPASMKTYAQTPPVFDLSNDPDRIICRRVNRRGSFTKVRVCARQHEWLEVRQRSVRVINESREFQSYQHISPQAWALGTY